jgi:hypothetical protein
MLIIIKYAINPKAFLGYLEKGNASSFHPFDLE